MGLITLNSCYKEQIENKSINQSISTKPVTEMTDKEVELKIRGFISKAESNVKSIEELSTEDAIWNIEAALNYTFCINKVELIVEYTETIDFNITDNNGNINFNEVANVFNNLKIKTTQLKSKAKYISVINVDEENGKVFYTISKENTIEKYTGSQYQIYGDWKWGEELGECNGNNVGSDALLQIRSKIALYKLIFPYGTYWTDILTKALISTEHHNDNDDIWDDNLRDYLLFFRQADLPNFSTCISNSDVNWYKNNTWSIMNSISSNIGRQPICWSHNWPVVYDNGNIPGTELSGMQWNHKFECGIKHYNPGGYGM
jgi:hypothetical protein